MANKAQRIGGPRKAPAQKANPVRMTSPMKMNGEDNWRARDDAETIARAAAIKADPGRRAAAAKEAGKMADERGAQVRALRGLAKGGR